MIRLTRAEPGAGAPQAQLSLTLDQRVKSRLRARLDNGDDVGVFLERGDALRHGDRLIGDDGRVVGVRAAPERVSSARCEDALLLARTCYHLGNRHVALQIEPDRVSWLHDHVLDDMVRGLGLSVEVIDAPFEPEPGAYGSGHAGGQAHGHHGHGHDHGHD